MEEFIINVNSVTINQSEEMSKSDIKTRLNLIILEIGEHKDKIVKLESIKEQYENILMQLEN